MTDMRQAIKDMISISENELELLMDFWFTKTFGKKTLLSDDEKFIDEVYFINKGIIRVKITDTEGKQHTTHFAIENQFVADYSAFLTNTKSKYQLEALEQTDVTVLPKKAIEWGYENMKEGEKLGRLIAEYYYIYLDTRIQHMYTLTPKQRYELMDKIFPNIHQRVPQHMIASYLGITPIHLSRLKSKK
jgi:CRP-like cAMP-binding protein